MKHSIRIGAVIIGIAFCLPAAADTRFRIRRMTRDDVPLGKGQCDIRLQVDNEAEVSVRGDNVLIHTISGRDPYDDGSECNAPLPDRQPVDFRFEVKDSRGEIRLIAEPSRRNDFAAVVLIRDSAGGTGRYHFRLSWDMRAADFRETERPRQGPPGFVWNNTLTFSGVGRGVETINGNERRLFDVNVAIDRGGRAIIRFRAERGRELSFTGQVVSREDGRLRCDVMTEDRRMRGPMFISVGERENVNSISFEGGDGRDRMRVNWDRR
jgi:hypothetical protein